MSMSSQPKRSCDLVMKGGITSGVVYPMAIQEIAERFNLVGIGGTSAGAIAAVVAAAAEYRRRTTGSSDGFKKLERVVKELSEEGRMKALFRPDSVTQDHFDSALTFLENRGTGIFKAKLLWKLRTKQKRADYFLPIINNGFGVCSGMAGGDSQALTPWLSGLIDEIAGLEKGRHLTFHDLHNAPLLSDMEEGDRSIDLRTVTTCLTFNRPFEFPNNDNTLAFDPKEWHELFPKTVVDQLVTEAEKIHSPTLEGSNKLPLPTEQLPIIVAARMSMSFPLLLSMVPLWAINFDLDEQKLQRLWFSDGGITSNFPVHRFDSIYPQRPTLAINLQYYDENEKPQRAALRRLGESVFLSKTHGDGLNDLWNVFMKKDDPVGSLFGFGWSIFNSAQNWHDNAYLKLPGYRDRTAEIWLKGSEGGLNLDMKPETITLLVERGRSAGQKLAERFSDDSDTTMSWYSHRWIRLRAGMDALADLVEQLGKQVGCGEIQDADLLRLLDSVESPPSYRFNNKQEFNNAVEFIRSLSKLADQVASTERPPFVDGPRPKVTLGSRAPF